jgi:hypothetical protein
LDEQAKAALRAAELPFLHTQLFEGRVDKSVSVVQYCKALDITLEQRLGRRILSPLLDVKLGDMQNIVCWATLDAQQPVVSRVLDVLRLRAHYHADALPLSKLSMVARDVMNGRIVSSRGRTLDGLKAWGAFLLLFCREVAPANDSALLPAPFPLPAADGEIVSFARRLCALQDVRNPVAHRATVLRMNELDFARREAEDLFERLAALFDDGVRAPA